MSNRPSRRRGSSRSDLLAAQRNATMRTARALGCVCDPEMHSTREDGMPVVKVLHDESCPMAGFGSTYTLYRTDAFLPH